MSIIQGNSKTSAAAAGYTIDQSIRFNDNDSAHLSRTPSSAGDKRTWTWSCWIKRANIGTSQELLFCGPSGTNLFQSFLKHDNTVYIEDYNGSAKFRLITDRLFRDTSAWYHLMIVFDTTQATSSDRGKLYINGQRETSFSTEIYPALNYEGRINATVQHTIGERWVSSDTYLDAYLAEINFIDGQALDPTSFGEVNADTGQWVPIEYTGTYGTNGFYITGADSADLGADDSGNGNDFTSSGLTADDQMLDTPTDNYATMNSIGSGLRTAGSMADGNLKVTTGTTIEGEWYFGTQRLQGNVYWEVYINSIGNSRLYCGVGIDGDDYAHVKDDHWVIYSFNGTFYNQGSAGKTSSAISATSTLQFAFSEDNDALWVGVDGTWLYSATQAEIEAFTTTNKANSTSFGGIDLFPVVGTGSSTNVVTYNFGQTAFTYTKPAGYSAISTASLDDPTIALPEKYFNTVLYEGNGGGQRVGQFQPITETYSVPNSVIFNNNDSAYLEKTYASSESTLTAWSFSAWVKRSLLADEQFIFQAGTTSANLEYLRFTNSDTLEYKLLLSSSLDANYITDQVFKDTSSWMHIYAYRSSTTFKLYINGTEVTEFSTSNAPGSSDGMFGKNVRHRIGGDYSSTPGNLFGGYLAEINFIPGTAQAVSDFGQLDASTNRWIPKDASGLTFGTNGFYLDMETAPGTGSGAGTDSSGNGNNFTESGLAASDQVTDSPTENFCVLHANQCDSGDEPSDGNLKLGTEATNIGTIGVTSGKWYWECTCNATNIVLGITNDPGQTHADAYNDAWGYQNNGSKYYNSTTPIGSYGDTYTTNDVISVALDLENGAIWFAKNGTWQASATVGEIEAGTTTNAAFDSGFTGTIFPWFYTGSTGQLTANFGQKGFTYTPPTGFSAISNDNLPLSNGDLSAFVWIKNRDAADNHMLFDAVRGATKDMHSNSTAAEVTNANTLTRFLKNGFEVGNNAEVNTSAESYVAWQWLNDSLTTSTNTDGSITSTVLANTTSGFSTATYTGNGTSGATFGHGLGVAPKMVIVKERSPGGNNWMVGHDSVGWTKYLALDSNAAPVTSSTRWNDTAPSSTVVTLGNDTGINASGATYVAYCFAEVEGFSKIGMYTGNGSTDGAFVYTGFKPAFVLWKQFTNLGTNSFIIRDSAREPFNVVDTVLFPNTTAGDTTGLNGYGADLLSNGFKLRGNDGAVNKASSDYLYLAFAESPFKTATAR